MPFLFGQVGGASTTDLVVHDHGDIMSSGEILDGADTVVWNAGSAVEADERANTGWGRESAEYCVPLYLKIRFPVLSKE
jgi:hypothetical protein